MLHAPTNDVGQAIKSGCATVLIASPEAIVTRHWKDVLDHAYKEKLCMVAYDEAHCISKWGLDFREEYLKVGILQSITECPVLTLTATATTEIKNDIARTLGLTNDKLNVVSVLPDRPNIQLCATKTSENYEEELEWVKTEIFQKGRMMKKVIIYVNSISMCERLYTWLHSTLNDKAYDGEKTIGNRLIEMVHAHMDKSSKERIMNIFHRVDSTIRILIATVAVGMGIDIPDVSIVVTWGLLAPNIAPVVAGSWTMWARWSTLSCIMLCISQKYFHPLW
ncbi:hypothetical protein CHS0354_007380 [Potamilus streckersoni]|uniref:DNA 3'-5' helicase n=1 Tax=Potamilus streckersoni TaxID=2493646 RepID=A0AAE0TIP4_9BIVA|nr:hypothetical protein CHS0354_007380 [Potamilus streckersoni]